MKDIILINSFFLMQINVTERKSDQKQEGSEGKIFPVPFALEGIKENITITTNTFSKLSKEEIIEQALQKGVAAHKEGKLQEAERIYRAILQSQPFNPRANHNLGVLAVSENKSDAALPLFKIALEANPKIEQFWLSYIDTLIKENQDEVAKQVIEQAKKEGVAEEKLNSLKNQLKPTDTDLKQLLLFYQNGQFDKAEKLAISLVERFPNHPFSWKVLGALLKQTGRIIESLVPTQKSAELAPKDADAHSNLGVTLQELGRWEEAEASYRQAIALKPDFPVAISNLGVTLKELGRLEEAEITFKHALALNPNFVDAQGNLGNTLKELGRFEEAEASYRQAIALKPDFATAHFNLANTLQELGKWEKAKSSYKQSIALKPDYATAHFNLANTLKNLGNLEEAEASYRQAIALKPDFATAHFNLANMLQELGRLEEAEASYNQAIAFKPDYAEAQGNLAILFEDLGKFEESVAMEQQAFTNRTGIRPVGDVALAPATTGIFFEITNRCNFHCTFCPSDSQKRHLGSMELELVKQLYEENAEKKFAEYVHLHLMGEPTLHPDLIKILRFGSSKKVKTNLTTNISTLSTKNVSKILDELYGSLCASHMTPTKETYYLRGKVGISWDQYINNLRSLVREYMKRLSTGSAIKNNIVIRVMVTQNTSSNVSLIKTSKEASAILKEWNDFVAEVEHQLGMAQFKRKDHNDNDLVRGNQHQSTFYSLQRGIQLEFRRAHTFANTRANDDLEFKATKETYCSNPFKEVGVLWNGDVTLCSLDHDGQLKVGNVRDSSIETVIQSEAAQKLRASMLGDAPLPSICQTCQERACKTNNP
ncbi:tetratricopeptide repeat protein [Prochlorococcus marinus]|uniref:tetratricopeptide repeat protein n=1 Tax=Prochlorococcus marinus TaxID=1219 RepID=UPI0022B33DEA|nr:tetratricopeptide repeat protein [Prochlorococcus marinus]